MPTHEDFIVELGTEELPPTSLDTYSRAFHDQLLLQIKDAGLDHQQSFYYATPRRLAVIVQQLVMAQPDKTSSRQGPYVKAAFDEDGNPTPAANGFAKSCGVSVNDLQQLETEKGLRLTYQIKATGETTEMLMPDLVQRALDKLPIAKAMRWGSYDHSFIRPVKWLLMMHGKKVVPCNLYHCKSANLTCGHRFLAAGELALSSASDYLQLLESNYVIADFERRKNIIQDQIQTLAQRTGATAIIDPNLLDEVTALVEWPVALIGEFDKAFLDVPQEALISTMATNQKYFHLQDNNQQLLPKFITIANIESNNPQVIVAGNEKVIRPRLADAKFFFDQDSKRSLLSRTNELDKIVFQKQLGSMLDKTMRIKTLASDIATIIGIDPKNLNRAAVICKSDLVTNMVTEFPSLQGIMGRYYALNDGENDQVAKAMNEIYMPRFSGDQLPTTETGLLLSLADRLDSLTGLFAVKQIPTGNKDPFALRRAALGILRIIIEKKLALDLVDLVNLAAKNFTTITVDSKCKNAVLDFFAARLKSMYLDKGYTSSVIQSVQALAIYKPCDIDARIQAVHSFAKIPQALALAKTNKRVANILAKNEKGSDIKTVDPSLLEDPAEKALFEKISSIKPNINNFCLQQDYSAALSLLTELSPSIDGFFDSVMVMDNNLNLRKNRLALLYQLRSLFMAIADISCLQK